ncbi:MAG: tetratricopeptide repeat protein [Ktedonobacteraceae bacterium]|nr:tetratricopeptide repeat protein [Ktedonobacteraceae bacterium]
MPQKRYAYLIGANGPRQPHRVVETLKYAEKDIKRLETALSAHPCAFTEVNSIIADTPTPVIEGLELLVRKCEQSDLLVVHFSGHGYLDKHLYLICNETDIGRKLFTSGAIKVDLLKDILQDCPARHKLLILDCCHAAAANAGGTWTKEVSDLEQSLGDLKGNVNVILSACAPNRTTRELDRLEIDNEQGAGFLSWAIARACSKDFMQAAHDQALSLNDIWRWVMQAQGQVNQTLSTTEQIPLPRLFGEKEGPDDEIWFTSRRRKTLADKHDELKQHEEFATHEQEEYLRQYCFGASIEDFDRTKLLEYAQKQHDYEKLPIHNILELCRHLGLTSGTGMPRREAVLAFHPIPSRYLSSAFIRVFASSSGSNEYTSGDLEGSLADQAKMAEIWLLNRLEKIAANIGSGERTERSEIPERALRELIVNALVHRDYKANESIHIKITPKQVIITNPGQLDPAIIACDPPFAYSESHPRNSRLLRILTTQKWAEGNALGFQIVREEFEKYGLALPEIKNLPGGLVQVTIQRPDLSSISRNETATSLFPIWTVPYHRNPFFTGREQVLKKLANALQTGQTAALSQSYAISGLGGIGKTQTAVEYAYRYQQKYQAVFWIQADTRESLLSSFTSIADLLKLPEKEKQDQLQLVKSVHQWLRIYSHWLLILDNANDLAMIEEFLPTGTSGHILLTTHAVTTGFLAQTIKIGVLDIHQSALFLLHRAGLLSLDASLEQASPNEVALARDLSRDLDGLPLAVDQAGAYIDETGCDLAAYLKLYRRHRVSLLQRRGTMPADHPEPVTTTLTLAFALVERNNSAAMQLLSFCAFLHPDAIPEELFSTSAALLGPLLAPIATDPLALDEAITTLLKYSLVHRNSAENSLSLHRLVQAVLKDNMDEGTQMQWAERAVRAVSQIFPLPIVETWPQCQRYLSQAITCAELIEQYNLFFAEAASLLGKTGIYEQDRALYSEAESLLKKALFIKEQVLGLDNPDTAQSLNNLALLYQNQGKYQEAEPLYQRSLAIFEERLGSHHPDTATSLNNLALLYQNQGKYQEAEPLYQRSLAIFEERLGSHYPDTATSLNNLANLYQSQDKYQEAETLLKRALAIREEMLGEGHPNTAISLNNLANLYQSQGKYQEAETLLKRALAIREEMLGEGHPNTAISLNNLASLYHHQGKYQEAGPLYQQALMIFQQVLGTGHPYTTKILKNYAALLRQTGHKTEAIQLENEVNKRGHA